MQKVSCFICVLSLWGILCGQLALVPLINICLFLAMHTCYWLSEIQWQIYMLIYVCYVLFIYIYLLSILDIYNKFFSTLILWGNFI